MSADCCARVRIVAQIGGRQDCRFKGVGRSSTAQFSKVDADDISKYDVLVMTTIAKKLDASMNRWAPETAKKVEQLVAEIIELADHDALDLLRSRQVEQEVLDIIDGRQAR